MSRFLIRKRWWKWHKLKKDFPNFHKSFYTCMRLFWPFSKWFQNVLGRWQHFFWWSEHWTHSTDQLFPLQKKKKLCPLSASYRMFPSDSHRQIHFNIPLQMSKATDFLSSFFFSEVCWWLANVRFCFQLVTSTSSTQFITAMFWNDETLLCFATKPVYGQTFCYFSKARFKFAWQLDESKATLVWLLMTVSGDDELSKMSVYCLLQSAY